MTEHEIAFVKKCIRENIHRFYTWGKWKALREQVLELDKYECQLCKKRGKYTKATTVHHVNYVKKHPDKALEIWYSFRGEKRRNLISLCHDCHEEVHGRTADRRKMVKKNKIVRIPPVEKKRVLICPVETGGCSRQKKFLVRA